MNPQMPIKVTGSMIGQHPLPTSAYIGHAQNIYQIFGKFMRSSGQGLGARQPERVRCKYFQITVLEHGGARARWNHHISGSRFEDPDGMFSQAARLRAQPAIKSGLPAARLPGRKFDLHTQAAQNADNSLASFRVKSIY